MESKDSNTETFQEEFFGHEHVTVIEPAKGWRALDFKELWAYRELFWVLTLRDIKVRYKQTVLGVAWAVLQPVLTMLIFTVVFGGLAKIPSDGYPYAIFVFAALLPWTFFANAVSTSSTSLINASNMVSKVYFPRLIIPLSSIGSGLVDLAISTLVLFALMLWFGVGWSFNLLLIPLLLLAVIFTALGVGTLLSALTVAYRDFRFVVPFMVQIWMYATPVVYPVSLVPEKWQWLLFLNPMTGVIEAFRSAFLDRPFDLPSIAISLLMSVVIFIVGVAYFERVERRFADII
ncbi:MAG: ABC transporter permease [Mariprofundaceae bacterium]|nr:ABC transporter permease [Mariprofundaceae bacterium]